MKILISGAGIAGLSTAWWLKAYGFKPTVIEVSPTLRNKGYMMDFFGSGIDVAKAMGIIPELKKIDHNIQDFVFTKPDGSRNGSFQRRQMKKHFVGNFYSVMRGELEDILYKKVKNKVPIRFGTSIKSLKQTKNKVTVTFTNGKKEDFDLVIGADGIASRVRELTFGPHKKFMKYLGYYVGAYIINKKWANNFESYAEVNRMAGVYPISKTKLATFMVYKSKNKGVIPPNKRYEALQKAFKGCKSFVPEILDALKPEDEIYMDMVTQIKMPHWSKGRVTLVGDAGACLTLLAGQGATMAMCEAHILAKELKKAGGDHEVAFAEYERVLKPIILQKQKEAADFTGSFTPKKKWTLWVYNLATKYIGKPWVLKWVFRGFDAGSFFGKDYPKPKKP